MLLDIPKIIAMMRSRGDVVMLISTCTYNDVKMEKLLKYTDWVSM